MVVSFKELDKPYVSKVKIGNGELVDVKGKGMIEVKISSGTKFISDVLFVPDICQSLLNLGHS
ncbi:putative LRR receptor-like serine/threonine-protein kinase [Gossypium australe]|uniref:Putative LRR receptor-like serine/threonine-protein kinase n=1 Tax=Gossypium australe TaxID=47621 RepID=A0A5B6WMV1_9ROSI|nr:putative LRR receptor-like serine/threonine-protein kinase [Gossypium australe]